MSSSNPIGLMGQPGEKRTWFQYLTPIFLTIVTYLGIKVVFPKEQIDTLSATQAQLRVDHTTLLGRHEAHVIMVSNEIIAMKADIRRSLVLQCATIDRNDRAYVLADCNIVLGR